MLWTPIFETSLKPLKAFFTSRRTLVWLIPCFLTSFDRGVARALKRGKSSEWSICVLICAAEIYASKALTGQVSRSDLAITIHAPLRNWSVFDDVRKIEAYEGKNVTSQAFIWLNSLKRQKKTSVTCKASGNWSEIWNRKGLICNLGFHAGLHFNSGVAGSFLDLSLPRSLWDALTIRETRGWLEILYKPAIFCAQSML